MGLKTTFKAIRNHYVISQVQNAKLPSFESDGICRYELLFKGRVQKVGFRLEVCEMSQRLGLTGFCRNLENGDVLAQIQGPKNKIMYLVSFMQSLKRIKVNHLEKKEIPLVENETKMLKQ